MSDERGNTSSKTMSSTLKTILTIASILHLSYCEDWCPIIYPKPNSSLTGLKSYEYIDESGSTANTYVMFHRNNSHIQEWKFTTGQTSGSLEGFNITLIDGSLTVNKVLNQITDRIDLIDNYIYKCEVVEWPNKIVFERVKHSPQSNTTQSFLTVINIGKPFIVFKANNLSIIIIDKNNRANFEVKNAETGNETLCTTTQVQPQWCSPPEYMVQMDESLFKQIQSVVELTSNGQRVHLLFFDINGRIEYCFTFVDQNLPYECKRQTLKEECLPPITSEPPKPSQSTPSGGLTEKVTTETNDGMADGGTDEPTNSPKSDETTPKAAPTETQDNNVLLFVIIIIVVIIVIIGIIVVVFLLCNKKKESPSPTAGPTAQVSDKKEDSNSRQKASNERDNKLDSERSKENLNHPKVDSKTGKKASTLVNSAVETERSKENLGLSQMPKSPSTAKQTSPTSNTNV